MRQLSTISDGCEMDADALDKSPQNEILRALTADILSGKAPLGAPLRETSIAERFGVSRAVVREVLHRLNYEGLANTIPMRGTYVINPSPSDVLDLLEVRESLEKLAARLAAQRISRTEIRALRAQLLSAQRKMSAKAGYPEDLDFHAAIVHASRNHKLIELVPKLLRQISVLRQLSGASASRASDALSEHTGIVDAIELRDSALAENAIERHLRASSRRIIELLKKR
jgi:DNA-binding GntR family transcriptional regulator